MNTIYSPNDSESRKTRARSYFHEVLCQRSLFNTSTKKQIKLISLNLAELVVNELTKIISKKLPIVLFLSYLSFLKVKISKFSNKLENFTKVLINIVLIYQSSNFGGEGSWNENLWEDLKLENSLKIYTIFLLFVNLYVDEKSEQVKMYLWIKK